MKLYSKQSDEGLRQVIGYECDTCHKQESGEDVPANWHSIIHHYHICPDCYSICKKCNTKATRKYAESHWKYGICERC